MQGGEYMTAACIILQSCRQPLDPKIIIRFVLCYLRKRYRKRLRKKR